VGWSIDSHQIATLVTNALGMAVRDRQPSGTVVNSDHGVQYTIWAFARQVRETELVPSMGSIGDCFDNVVIIVLGPDPDRAAQSPESGGPKSSLPARY
jgi:transposase InsO family protein